MIIKLFCEKCQKELCKTACYSNIKLCRSCYIETLKGSTNPMYGKKHTQKTKIKIYTAGSFDLCHFGHLKILQKAKQYGNYLIVGVSTNKLIKQHKNINPVIPYRERAALIKALRCVDKVVKQSKLLDIEQMKKLKFDIFVIGDDWKNRTDNEGLNWLKEHKKVIFLPYTKHLSSSKIKEKIINNAVKIIKSQSKRNG